MTRINTETSGYTAQTQVLDPVVSVSSVFNDAIQERRRQAGPAGND
jgi:hypothetical protein